MRGVPRLLVPLVVLALLPTAVLVPARAQATAASHRMPATTPRLQIMPSTMSLGGRVTVRLSGLRAGEPVTIVTQPLHLRGFGGGLMGTWKADAHGVIHFAYPIGTWRWEIGPWRISTQGNAGVHASTTLTIIAR